MFAFHIEMFSDYVVFGFKPFFDVLFLMLRWGAFILTIWLWVPSYLFFLIFCKIKNPFEVHLAIFLPLVPFSELHLECIFDRFLLWVLLEKRVNLWRIFYIKSDITDITYNYMYTHSPMQSYPLVESLSDN